VASIAVPFPYENAALGTTVIYVSLAFAAALRFGFLRGLVLGVILGFVDATVGWAVSWAIGPGRVPPEQFSFAIWAATCLFVLGLGALYGLVGAGMGALVRKVRAA
jgi:hypothetical protein